MRRCLVNDRVSTSYQYDAADNRTNVITTGVVPRVVVVPLNGFQVIVLPPPS